MKTKKNLSCCNISRKNEGKENSASVQTSQVMAPSKTMFTEKMVYLPGGEFLMGTNEKEGFPADGEGPVRKVEVNPFLIDSYAVTNAEFNEFVKATGYKTESEKFGWSFVFHSFLPSKLRNQVKRVVHTPWWCAVDGAFWYQPEGPGSSIDQRMDHPVVHVTWNDALAFCQWTGKRLPTEAEWEYAARGGLELKRYPWGDELTPNGEHYCNIWQGTFPEKNTKEDGYEGTAPAQSFLKNEFGLYNMSGNVWEWCSDWFSRSIHKRGGRTNPQGPSTGDTKVMRGGSYLCHESYCNRYRVAARTSNTPDSSSGHLGFRCVADV
ncbi:formylglycine-generating enzyme family protein [uncultured Metabacillus sp.]|uniref:formylglycine-generating enzyme family protein n=1 Tax=uncultured Metabacillus sp. TaxID=2860135 RepID=UPI00262F7E72|nr:formylglycine-generating enzyme family protein [uncultured Metabacillus sp.]